MNLVFENMPDNPLANAGINLLQSNKFGTELLHPALDTEQLPEELGGEDQQQVT